MTTPRIDRLKRIQRLTAAREEAVVREAKPPELAPRQLAPRQLAPRQLAPRQLREPTVEKSGGASHEMSHREARIGQGLNAIATAGGLHAAYLTGKEIKHKVTGAPLPKTHARSKKAALAVLGGWGVLHGLELGSDVISARALHQQAQKTKPKEPVVAKSIGIAQSNGHGRRIREEEVSKRASDKASDVAVPVGTGLLSGGVVGGGIQAARAARAGLRENKEWGMVEGLPKAKSAKTKAERAARIAVHTDARHAALRGMKRGGLVSLVGAGVLAPALRHQQTSKSFTTSAAKTGAKVLGAKPKGPESIAEMRRRFRASLQSDLNAKTGTTITTSKARRYDPEADRQRRLGAYGGLAGGAAIVTGERAAREFASSKIGDKKTGFARHIGFKAGRTKRGLALTAATAGLAGIAAGTTKRGVSARNQTWT